MAEFQVEVIVLDVTADSAAEASQRVDSFLNELYSKGMFPDGMGYEILNDAAVEVSEPETDNWGMFTPEGDACVQQHVERLIEEMRSGKVTRLMLEGWFHLLRRQIAARGHLEVYDTEPREAIIEALNKVCDDLGWKGIDCL